MEHQPQQNKFEYASFQFSIFLIAFRHLFLFVCTQPRDVKIRDAAAKLAQSTITPDEFLRQVVYQSPDVCNGLLAFDSVATNEDEVIDALEQPPSQETSRNPTPEPQGNVD